MTVFPPSCRIVGTRIDELDTLRVGERRVWRHEQAVEALPKWKRRSERVFTWFGRIDMTRQLSWGETHTRRYQHKFKAHVANGSTPG